MEFTLWLGVTSVLACYLSLLHRGIRALRCRERSSHGGWLRLIRGLLEFHFLALVGIYVLFLLGLARVLPWSFAT